MLLSATNPAAYSLLPSANSFQTITIAMQRASPMRISPTMYSGQSCKKVIAKRNINTGPMIQFSNNDTPRTFVFLKTSLSFSYFTFVKGGYIIKISPMASGILVVPDENELIKLDDEGMKQPIATPIAMAKKIHKVRYLSKNPSFFRSCAGAQLLVAIFCISYLIAKIRYIYCLQTILKNYCLHLHLKPI